MGGWVFLGAAGVPLCALIAVEWALRSPVSGRRCGDDPCGRARPWNKWIPMISFLHRTEPDCFFRAVVLKLLFSFDKRIILGELAGWTEEPGEGGELIFCKFPVLFVCICFKKTSRF